jgi:CheY-like chemotaxis protein
MPRRGLRVDGDPIRLSQVVSNLLTNAAKYTPPGGHVTVRAEHVDADVVLRVRDTGIGIAPDVLPRIFDLFVQERQAIDRSQGGLGLGLSIVRNLIERHGGSVLAQSDGVGRGSEFVLRLPGARRPLALDPIGGPLTASASGPEAVAASGGVPRVLVVDDNEDAAEMLVDALTRKGYETRVAYDAPTALRVAAAFSPDVAFLDIGLPVMDGYELAAHLHKIPGLAALRLIALTGYGQESDYQKTREAGFHDHLVKPVDVAAIEAALAACK